MMISAFARESGLTIDTVRFYVRRGLMHPRVGQKGGQRPYQMFATTDLEKARVIRAGRALGLTLGEVKSFLDEHAGENDATLLAFLGEQRARLEQKAAELQKLISFLDAKIAWVQDPVGDPPPLPQ